MRVAFFSPMPPARSGIADYSEALARPLSNLVDLTVFSNPDPSFKPSDFDIALYQVGNNGHHAFVYEEAIRTPGVTVLHEANLHHLIAEMTIKRNDWDRYLCEAEYDGGPEALEYAKRVRALEVGPDYDGVPMLRRILEGSKGALVHSRFVEAQVRRAGFEGPVAVVPHGAWIPSVDRMGYRHRLGVEPSATLIGIFGFLKPYKRIAESLRAFKRLLRVEPKAKLILVGEPHPELPLRAIVQSLGIEPKVRAIGFASIEDFAGYIGACDIVLNLRYPTVGETSGTLLRALGLGRAVVVSDVGAFSEYPDDVCLKVPVDATEEDVLFEYLNLLTMRTDVREAMGENGRRWVERECNWPHVAARYASFLEAVARQKSWVQAAAATAAEVPVPALSAAVPEPPETPAVDPEYVLGWAPDHDAESYIRTHMTRLVRTLEMTPPGSPDQRILEMGAYLQITPALKTKLGYGEVRGCYYGELGHIDHKQIQSRDGEVFTCEVDHFDAERDRFPYPDNYYDTVLCCELLEHLPTDPMHMMSEVNRILKPGGHLLLTTPNICGLRAISAILQSYHPGFFPAYIRPSEEGESTDARHAREYAPREIVHLFLDAGFETLRIETGEFREEPHPEHEWVRLLLRDYKLNTDLRGDGIYALGVKRGQVQDRYPSWLYN